MEQFIKLSLPNSLILIMDFLNGEIPSSMENSLIAANKTCIAVGTLSEYDGETEITLSTKEPMEKLKLCLTFQGEIETPNKKVSIVSVNNKELLIQNVMNVVTKIQIFVNDNHEPDKIWICLK